MVGGGCRTGKTGEGNWEIRASGDGMSQSWAKRYTAGNAVSGAAMVRADAW